MPRRGTATVTPLRIQKLEIEDCEAQILRGYFEWGRGNAHDSLEPKWEHADEATRRAIALRGYDLYDGYPPQPGNDLSPTEIFLSVGINSRVVLNDACRFLARREQARPLLARIPDGTRLEDASDDQLDAAGELIALLEQARWLALGKVTKVLHKKRPAFIPVIDSVVGDFLWKNFPWAIRRTSGPRDVLAQLRTLLMILRPRLGVIQHNVAAQGFCLTSVRILDYLIWLGWREQVDKFGFGPPIQRLWRAKSVHEARLVAEGAWRAQIRS
jgi:hypothetical protein